MSMRLRRGSKPATPPPPDPGEEIFGPTQGAQAVRNNAGVRPITVPPGAIPFTSAQDLTSKLTLNPVGSSFVAANHIDWSASVNTGIRRPKIYVPNNLVMSGGARSIIGLVLNDGAELHGGIWENFGDVGSLEFHQPLIIAGVGDEKLVQDALFRNNRDKGFTNQGSNVLVDHCTMHNNGRYGWGSNEPTPGVRVENARFTNLEWFNNNTRNLAVDVDAGGNKLLATEGTLVDSCWGYNNTGAGLWFDFNPGAHVVKNNVLENNTMWGFFYEVGTGAEADGLQASAEVHNNFLKDNCTGAVNSWHQDVQLEASCSDGLMNNGAGYEFHHNVVDGTHRAMGFVDHNCHPFDVRGAWFHDNDIFLRTTTGGRVGGQLLTEVQCSSIVQFDPYAGSSQNRFTGNHYHVLNPNLAYWRWNNLDRTWSQWQQLGFDVTGSLVTI